MKKVVILGVSADIGFNIAKLYLQDGFEVFATYRNTNKNVTDLLKEKNICILKCDLTDRQKTHLLAEQLEKARFNWTHLFSSVGTSTPIGKFFDLDFEEWQKSIDINFTSQLRTLHSIYRFRDKTGIATINFMAGGGTNSTFDNYSAYTVSKIGLIKFCELLNSEYEDVKIQIVGPGFVKTKTHYETLEAGEAAGDNLKRVKDFMSSEGQGTKFEEIYNCLKWFDQEDKDVVSGRNYSVVHDQWGNERLKMQLAADKNMYKLRRSKNDWK
jgi:short-subunit dehydrogenase